MIENADILVTGGAGSLGRAIARKRMEEGWTGKLTVFSRDTFKHDRMRRMFPDQKINFVQGDILSPELLHNAMVGHDIVIHAAACKVIPTSEYQSMDTFQVNVLGSMNVCFQAVQAGIKHVLGISTDKACHAANAYGASKYMMEKSFQEYSRSGYETQFHLVRYGNVLESTGSVLEAWANARAHRQPIKITNPKMTRFWLSPKQAAKYAIQSLDFKSGIIFVPMMPALSIEKLAEYFFGEMQSHEVTGIRPGEKLHETLMTIDEAPQAAQGEGCFIILPTTFEHETQSVFSAYSSDAAPELTREQLHDLLND